MSDTIAIPTNNPEAIVIRFDTGQIISEPYKDGNGYLNVEATIASPGILSYVRADGSTLNELRTPETNQKLVEEINGRLLPVTNRHPPTMLNSGNTIAFQKGTAGYGRTRYDGGYVKTWLTIMDEQLEEEITKKLKTQTSLGYFCLPKMDQGVWENIPYERVQDNIKSNHIAICEKGRAAGANIHYFDEMDLDAVVGELTAKFDGNPIDVAFSYNYNQRYYPMSDGQFSERVEGQFSERVLAALESIQLKLDSKTPLETSLKEEEMSTKFENERLNAYYDALQTSVAELQAQLVDAQEQIGELQNVVKHYEDEVGYWDSEGEFLLSEKVAELYGVNADKENEDSDDEETYDEQIEAVVQADMAEIEQMIEEVAHRKDTKPSPDQDPQAVRVYLRQIEKMFPVVAQRLDEDASLYPNSLGDINRLLLSALRPDDDYSARTDAEVSGIVEGLALARNNAIPYQKKEEQLPQASEPEPARNDSLEKALALAAAFGSDRRDAKGSRSSEMMKDLDLDLEEEPDESSLKRAKLQEKNASAKPKYTKNG